MQTRIIILEPEAMAAMAMADLFEEPEFVVCGIANRPSDALMLTRRYRPDCVLLDAGLLDFDEARAFAQRLKTLHPAKVLVMTDDGDPSLALRARQSDGIDCLRKPCRPEELMAAVRRLAS